VRILVDPGSFNLLNMGDVAMLQATVHRLRSGWPEAVLQVSTDDPEALIRCCGEVMPISAEGRRIWLEDTRLVGRLRRTLPRTTHYLRQATSSLRRASPAVLESLLQLRLRGHPDDWAQVRTFLTALAAADLLVVAGQGGLSDHAPDHALAILDLVAGAQHYGCRTAMLGQGVGPLNRSSIRRVARRVLPGVELLTLRERSVGVDLVRGLGVPEDRVSVTGDAAVELAFARAPSAVGHALGCNFRLAESAGTTLAMLEAVGSVILEFARVQSVSLLPIPIAHDHRQSDARVIAQLLRGQGGCVEGQGDLATPGGVIAQIGHCRAIVTGAYHAAVFALAQGIPAVCLAASRYFRTKLEGLADMFGPGCEVVGLTPVVDQDLLRSALARAWASSPYVRDSLRAAAARQIGWTDESYRRLIAGGHAGFVITGGHGNDASDHAVARRA
jgi:polysaccharide pyruvyl transferase WcaK-like protein